VRLPNAGASTCEELHIPRRKRFDEAALQVSEQLRQHVILGRILDAETLVLLEAREELKQHECLIARQGYRERRVERRIRQGCTDFERCCELTPEVKLRAPHSTGSRS
jgi:hypothetical protein